jgi:choline dehydrogenase-like flavoprotein
VSGALTADVCVVGAGAGGAVVAAELAEGGASVILLEQGHAHDTDDFTARPPEMLARLYKDGAQIATVGKPPIPLPLGHGLGGTTVINSGTCFRTPPHVLERWSSERGLDLDSAMLDRCFQRVETSLSISEVTPELAGANAAVARRGAERLGWSHGYLRRNARGCVGSGVCAFGCPTSAKQHTGITYVPRAKAAGAKVITGVTARKIITSNRRAAGVQTTGLGTVEAQTVIVCTGTINTPLLLARSGLGRGSGELGRNLSLHPAAAAFGVMEEVVDMARGVPQSFYIDEFAAEGIMFETVAGPPGYVAMTLPLTGARHAEAMTQYRHLAQLGAMVSDESRGRVDNLAGRPLVRYDLSRRDLARFRAALGRLEQVLKAAGAREVILPLMKNVAPAQAQPGHLQLAAFHPLGTARADARPTHGVVDGDLELHATRGVYIADGSVIPTALGVNPQLTIMGLATRLAFHLLDRSPPRPARDEALTPS